jgi:glutathione gamma-glutamylcysteinyltransferase
MTPNPSLYRRPLPADLVDFSSPEGRRLLAESIRVGTAEAFFPLVAQLHTQAEPAWCGLGTLVTVLNALEIDPGRAWRGNWRWFGEELLDCCKAMELASVEGLTLSEVACLARCNGADAEVHHAEPGTLAQFRADLEASCRAPKGDFIVAGYSRAALNQTGSGHYSPLAAWHPAEDRVLILDVARFKYPPHWATVEALWQAMESPDPATAQPRGWIRLRRAETMPEAIDAEAEALAARLRVCP